MKAFVGYAQPLPAVWLLSYDMTTNEPSALLLDCRREISQQRTTDRFPMLQPRRHCTASATAQELEQLCGS